MFNQPELFPSVNQIPPKGLSTQREQAIDPLEGFKRKEEGEEEGQGYCIVQIKNCDPMGYVVITGKRS